MFNTMCTCTHTNVYCFTHSLAVYTISDIIIIRISIADVGYNYASLLLEMNNVQLISS